MYVTYVFMHTYIKNLFRNFSVDINELQKSYLLFNNSIFLNHKMWCDNHKIVMFDSLKRWLKCIAAAQKHGLVSIKFLN